MTDESGVAGGAGNQQPAAATTTTTAQANPAAQQQQQQQPGKSKSRAKSKPGVTTVKRRCCDGNTPSCAACSSVYHTPCVYDPNSDHRRKGVYKQDIDNLKNRNTTLLTLIQGILNYDEEDVLELVREIRSCEDLEVVAESIIAREKGLEKKKISYTENEDSHPTEIPQFETELAGKISELRLDGSVKFVGGTSNLVFLPPEFELDGGENPIFDANVTSWTKITSNKELIRHLLTMYFTWHYAYFTTLSKKLFFRDFLQGRSSQHCSPLLVNAMLALGCHFSSWPAAREDPNNSATAGDHFFKEAKRLILDNDEHEKAKLCTVQALALMSVREAGCGREGSGWVYSGMSFRMALDLGLNVDVSDLSHLSDEDIDARRITFWGCYLFDKCWSNYLGRQPQLSGPTITVPKFDVFPDEEASSWSPYTDSGASREHVQPARTRAIALQISLLCEISSDLLDSFYHPISKEKLVGKQEELKRLTQLHTRLEAWRKGLPSELEPKEGQLPQVLLMHMFFQLLFIHLYRPFLKYTKTTSPLPAHVSPRKLLTQAAAMISKLLRIYKRSYGLHHICNVGLYIAHSACTIHLLNLPDKNAKRDIVHGLKNLEEMADFWPCARRTLRILEISARKWNIDLPPEAIVILERTHAKFGSWGPWDQVQSPSNSEGSPAPTNVPMLTTTPDPIPVSAEPSVPQLASVIPTAGPASTQYHKPQQLPPSSQAPHQLSLSQLGSTQSMNPHQFAMAQPPFIPRLSSQPKPESWAQHTPQPPACNASAGSTPPPAMDTPQISDFSNIDDLVQESQDWWLRDQTSLAFGLDNWTDSWDAQPTDPPVSMDFEPSLPAAVGNSTDQMAGGSNQGLASRQQRHQTPPSLGGAGAQPSSTMGIRIPVTLPDYEDDCDYLVDNLSPSPQPQQQSNQRVHPPHSQPPNTSLGGSGRRGNLPGMFYGGPSTL